MSNTENQWIMLVAVIFLIAGTFVVSAAVIYRLRDALGREAE